MTSKRKIVPFFDEARIDPAWPQKALAMWRKGYSWKQVTAAIPEATGRAWLVTPLHAQRRIEAVARMRSWSPR